MDFNQNLDSSIKELCELGVLFNQKNWVPATSGNFSKRLNNNQILITSSGVHKGFMNYNDLIVLNFRSDSIKPLKKPSAETGLHLRLYQQYPDVNAVLHTHSINSTFLSKKVTGSQVEFNGYELLKAFNSVDSHESSITIPIFENDQDINRLGKKIDDYLHNYPDTKFYLLRGHGIYVWGKTINEAYRQLEAAEFLIELKLMEIK